MMGLTVAKRYDLIAAAEGAGLIRRPRSRDEAVEGEPRIVVDTSVLIDGRIAEIVESGFIYGTLVVPRFVLEELQHIADSSDALRRNRGRRGLEILDRMQRDPRTPVEVVEDEAPGVAEVDAKLVELAKRRSRVVLTNDFNLNRVAELQGVRVMNINSLANAVKPAVLPGEELRVKVIQEGKEAGPGRRLPRRRDDDRGRGRGPADRPRGRRERDPRAPDRGRPDDLRPAAPRLTARRPDARDGRAGGVPTPSSSPPGSSRRMGGVDKLLGRGRRAAAARLDRRAPSRHRRPSTA